MRLCASQISWLPKLFSSIFKEFIDTNNTIEIVGEIIPEHSMLKKILASLYLGDAISVKLILQHDKIIISTQQYGISMLINKLSDGNTMSKEQVRKKVVQMLSIQINRVLPDKKQYTADYNLLVDCIKYRRGIIEYLDEKSLMDDDSKSIDYSVEKVIMPWIMNYVVKNICLGMVRGGDINNISGQTLIVLHGCIEKMVKNYIRKYKPEKSKWIGVALIATRLGLIHLGIDEECDLVEEEFNFSALSYFWKSQEITPSHIKNIFSEIERNIVGDTDFQPCGNILSQSSNIHASGGLDNNIHASGGLDNNIQASEGLPKLKRIYSI